MGDKTGISWTESTWNPLRGCSKVSAGCKNCYAETLAARFPGPGQPYEGTITRGRWNGEIRLVPEALDQPLRWTRPRRIFVNSMSDLFHEKVPTDYIDRVFGVMAAAGRHTFQVLTKRPEVALRYMTSTRPILTLERTVAIAGEFHARGPDPRFRWGFAKDAPLNAHPWPGWPLPNVWIGTSVEDQEAAELRVPLLRQVPAAVRFLSIEPMLGAVDLTGLLEGIGWVIVGGESGPGSRPMHPRWARDVRDQCEAAGVAYFFKQHGDWIAGGQRLVSGEIVPEGESVLQRLGKRVTGDYLDGVQHHHWPA